MFYPDSPTELSTVLVNAVGRCNLVASKDLTPKPSPEFDPSLLGNESRPRFARWWYDVFLRTVFTKIFLRFANNEGFVKNSTESFPDVSSPEKMRESSNTEFEHDDAPHLDETSHVQGRSYTCLHLTTTGGLHPFDIHRDTGTGKPTGFWIDCSRILCYMDNSGTTEDYAMFFLNSSIAVPVEGGVVFRPFFTHSTLLNRDVGFATTLKQNAFDRIGAFILRYLMRASDAVSYDHRPFMNWPSKVPLVPLNATMPDATHADAEVYTRFKRYVDEPYLRWSTAFAVYDLWQDARGRTDYMWDVMQAYRPGFERTPAGE